MIFIFSYLYFSNSIIFIPSLLNIAPSFSAMPMILAPVMNNDLAEFDPTLIYTTDGF